MHALYFFLWAFGYWPAIALTEYLWRQLNGGSLFITEAFILLGGVWAFIGFFLFYALMCEIEGKLKKDKRA